MTKYYDEQFFCNFQLQYFPFDIQKCQIGLAVPHSLKNKVKLLRGNLTISPMKYIKTTWVIPTTNGSSYSQGEEYVAFEITIRRVFFFHLATTYMPTTCLIIVSELILFLDEDHFDTIVMIALTTMLVMYTLYQGVSASLPQTTYMKYIDIWMVFGLMVPFVVFVASVGLRLLNNHNDDGSRLCPEHRLTVKSLSQVKDDLELEVRSKKRKQRCRTAVQIIIPGCTLAFIVIYAVLALAFYNDI